MKDYLSQQARMMAGDWETSIDRFYPEHAANWREPARQWNCLEKEWNTLEAVRWLDWPSLLPSNACEVLDLGAGTGWLSAFLSRLPEVAHIDTLDSGVHNLEVMLPGMIQIMSADASKITPILGLFYPSPAADKTYDVIAASSAIHHAPSLWSVLRECHRMLKDDGRLIILNETPVSTWRYGLRSFRYSLEVVADTVRRRYREFAPTVSSSGMLVDPYLGDRSYTWDQWEQAFHDCDFEYETKITPFSSYKNDPPHAPHLVHFICRKKK